MLFCLTERGGSHPPVFEILLARETKIILGWWANYSWSSDGAPHFVKPHPTMLSMHPQKQNPKNLTGMGRMAGDPWKIVGLWYKDFQVLRGLYVAAKCTEYRYLR